MLEPGVSVGWTHPFSSLAVTFASVLIGNIIGDLAAGTFGLAAGGYFSTKGIQLIPVSIATPITASSPLFAAAMGVLFFHERVRPVQWVGILCILSGVLAVNS